MSDQASLPLALKTLTTRELAYIVHGANSALRAVLGEEVTPWEENSHTEQLGIIAGVESVLAHPEITAEQLHEQWCQAKYTDGWVYGIVKDAAAKLHPCLVPYASLPSAQRAKDYLFRSIINTCGAHFNVISQ